MNNRKKKLTIQDIKASKIDEPFITLSGTQNADRRGMKCSKTPVDSGGPVAVSLSRDEAGQM